MKSDNLILLVAIGAVAYYLFKNPGALGSSASAMSSGASAGPVYAPVASQPGLAILITSNPNAVVPGSSMAFNQYLPPSQQVNPNDPPPILCQAGQWPTRTTTLSPTGWYCASPRVMI